MNWTSFTESPALIESTGKNIGGVKYTNNTLYFGVVGSNESSVYNCSTSINFTCGITVCSSKADITGNATTLTTDGVGSIYVAGNNLNSSDFGSSTLTTGAFLLFGNYATNIGTWQSISNTSTSGISLPTNVSSVTVASMLTSY